MAEHHILYLHINTHILKPWCCSSEWKAKPDLPVVLTTTAPPFS